MPAYKLYYFNGRGAAEMIRFVFAQAGVEYEDVRLQFGGDEWQKMKPGELAHYNTHLLCEGRSCAAKRSPSHCTALTFCRHPLGDAALS